MQLFHIQVKTFLSENNDYTQLYCKLSEMIGSQEVKILNALG